MPWRRYRPTDPRRYYVHVRTFLGRRGTFLALLGAVWVAQGVAAIATPGSSSYMLLNNGGEWRAMAWVATGAIAIIYATRSQGEDAPGFLALYLMAAYRAVAYGLGLFLWALPGGQEGDPRGAIGLLSWLVVIVAILVVAGWEESGPPRQPRRGAAP